MLARVSRVCYRTEFSFYRKICATYVMEWSGKDMCVAGSSAVCSQAYKRPQQFQQIRNRGDFLLLLFCSSRQKSQHSQLFLSFFQSHEPLPIQCNAGRKEHLYRSQPERFARQQNQRDVFLCPLQMPFSQQSQNRLKHGWYQMEN